MKRSSRSLLENGTPRACRPGGRCRDCYPGAPTLGRAIAAHLGFGCPKFQLRAPDPRLGRVVSGPRCRHHDGRPRRWFRDWLPGDMPHFHSIPFHSDCAVVYMRHNVDSCIHVVSLYIDNKHILNLNLVSVFLSGNFILLAKLKSKPCCQSISPTNHWNLMDVLYLTGISDAALRFISDRSYDFEFKSFGFETSRHLSVNGSLQWRLHFTLLA